MKELQAPRLSDFLSSLHLLSLLDILCQLPLDVLQHALTAVAGGPQFVWDSLQGLRASSKAGREFCNSMVQQVDVQLPHNAAGSAQLAKCLAQLNELQSLRITDARQPSERPESLEVAQQGHALLALLEAMQPASCMEELQLENTSVDSNSLRLVAQKFFNLRMLCLKYCGADDADLLRPLSACTRLISLSILEPSKGKLPDFESALPALSALTQLTSFCWDGSVRNLQLLKHIKHLTSLRVLNLLVTTQKGTAHHDFVAAPILPSLTQLEELHVAVLRAEDLLALKDSTVLTKLAFEEAHFVGPDEDTPAEAVLQSACMPGLQAISISERFFRCNFDLSDLCLLLRAAPVLQFMDWQKDSTVSWCLGEESASKNLAWLLDRSDKLPTDILEQLRLCTGPSEERLLVQKISSWPVVHACKTLDLAHVKLTPLVVEALIERFPNIQKLDVTLQRVPSMAFEGFLAWPQLTSIELKACVQHKVLSSFFKQSAAKGVRLHVRKMGAAYWAMWG